MTNILVDFEQLLSASVVIHGHLCAGQVLGVRMSMLGLQEIGIFDDHSKIATPIEQNSCALHLYA